MGRLVDANKVIENIDEWLDCVGYATIGKGLSYYAELMGCIEEAPTVETVPKGAYEQVEWERDMAVSQLNDYGVQLGEQADCVRVVRCKDCVYYGGDTCWNEWFDGFCSYGKRRDGD